MKRMLTNAALFKTLTGILFVTAAPAALASEAETSASATAGRRHSGTATGTARYEGDAGFARTDTRTGAVNAARSVAIGVDEDGLTLSLSLAVAPNRGPAYATTFNFSIGADGEASTSIGTALATGGLARTVGAGGRATATPFGVNATSTAYGSTQHGGMVRAETRSDHYDRRDLPVRRVIYRR